MNFELGIIRSNLVYVLPFSLFIFPSLLEEAFFRGVLIPNNAKEKGKQFIAFITLVSVFLFVLWHPLNTLTVNLGAREIFLNTSFLFILFCLGLVCSLSYIYSKSLWVPVIIHWFTVFFGYFSLEGEILFWNSMMSGRTNKVKLLYHFSDIIKDVGMALLANRGRCF